MSERSSSRDSILTPCLPRTPLPNGQPANGIYVPSSSMYINKSHVYMLSQNLGSCSCRALLPPVTQSLVTQHCLRSLISCELISPNPRNRPWSTQCSVSRRVFSVSPLLLVSLLVRSACRTCPLQSWQPCQAFARVGGYLLARCRTLFGKPRAFAWPPQLLALPQLQQSCTGRARSGGLLARWPVAL